METLNVSKNFIKRDFGYFLKDTNATKNKYTKEKFANLLVEQLVGFHGLYENKYLKTDNLDNVKKEILKVLEE